MDATDLKVYKTLCWPPRSSFVNKVLLQVQRSSYTSRFFRCFGYPPSEVATITHRLWPYEEVRVQGNHQWHHRSTTFPPASGLHPSFALGWCAHTYATWNRKVSQDVLSTNLKTPDLYRMVKEHNFPNTPLDGTVITSDGYYCRCDTRDPFWTFPQRCLCTNVGLYLSRRPVQTAHDLWSPWSFKLFISLVVPNLWRYADASIRRPWGIWFIHTVCTCRFITWKTLGKYFWTLNTWFAAGDPP